MLAQAAKKTRNRLALPREHIATRRAAASGRSRGGCDDGRMSHASKPRTWIWTVLPGLIVFCVYLANGRDVGSEDTEPARLLTYTLLRGDGPYLDRFRVGFEVPGIRAAAVRDATARPLGLALPGGPCAPGRADRLANTGCPRPPPAWLGPVTRGRRTNRRTPRRSSRLR